MEKIEFVYKPMAGGAYHVTVVYTPNEGNPRYLSFVADNYDQNNPPGFLDGVVSTAISAAAGEPGALGTLSYEFGYLDNRGQQRDVTYSIDSNGVRQYFDRVTVGSKEDMLPTWQKMFTCADEIKAENLTYSTLTQNSNSAAYTCAKAAGIEPPEPEGVFGSHWTPAADHILPTTQTQAQDGSGAIIKIDENGQQHLLLNDVDGNNLDFTQRDDGGLLFVIKQEVGDNLVKIAKDYNLDGDLVETQTAIYKAITGLTEFALDSSERGLIGQAVIEGQASDAQLAEAAALVKSAADAENFGQISVSDADGSSELEVLGDDTSAAMQSALQKADQNIASGVLNTNSSPVASSGSTLAQWLYQRGGAVTGVANDRLNTIVADLIVNPALYALSDSALAVSLAQQDPSPVNVLTALQKLLMSGVTLSDELKKSFAEQMGCTPNQVTAWLSAGGAAVTSMLVALKNPTPLNIASAMQQTILAGVTITPGLKAEIADALDLQKTDGTLDTGAVDNMLAYGGAALSVISVLSTKNPSPQQIIQASQQVVNILDAAKENAALQNLDYTLSTLGTVYSLYNFVEHPNNQTAVAVNDDFASWVA